MCIRDRDRWRSRRRLSSPSSAWARPARRRGRPVEALLRDLVTLGIAGLLCLLRLEAATFGAAEYDEPTADGRARTFRLRMGWYVLGLALVLAALIVHPAPGSDLLLGLGDRAGAILGFLLLAGVDQTLAVVAQAILYVLATRTAAPGRSPYVLALAIWIGLAAGWLTAVTGGIGAAFLGHAVTRIAVFVCTGHAGQPAARGESNPDRERE